MLHKTETYLSDVSHYYKIHTHERYLEGIFEHDISHIYVTSYIISFPYIQVSNYQYYLYYVCSQLRKSITYCFINIFHTFSVQFLEL